MLEPSIHDILSESFLKSSKEDWFRVASQELKGGDALTNLSWKVDELVFSPYYDNSDLKNISSDIIRNVSRPRNASQPGSWDNLPCVIVRDYEKANTEALHALQSGADGILFDLHDVNDIDLDSLLKSIDWHYCNVSFLVTTESKILTNILAHAKKKEYDLNALHGSVYWKEFPNAATLHSLQHRGLKNFHTLGWSFPSSTPVIEISNCLYQAVLIMDNIAEMSTDKETLFNTITLSASCSDNFFVTIAKLKALRSLWYQLAQAYEIFNYAPSDLYIHAFSENWKSEKFQPHASLIKNTVHAVAAVLGGCNALTLSSENENNTMMTRIGLNVSNICKEESHLDKVADAVAGSYALECMSKNLAAAAWKHFQTRFA